MQKTPWAVWMVPLLIFTSANIETLYGQPLLSDTSHSNCHAVAVTAFKATRGIGIDIQDEIDRDTYLDIKEHIIFGDEYDTVFQGNQDLTE